MEWVRTHYEHVSGRSGYADFYKRDAQLKLLDPIGTVIELWDLKGCFLTSVGMGELQYGVLEEKLFYDKAKMRDHEFSQEVTENVVKKGSFVESFLSSLRRKMNANRKLKR